MSLRLRLTLTYSFLLALILAIFGGVLYATMRVSLIREMDRRLEVRASQVELTVRPETRYLKPDEFASVNLDLSPLEALRAPGLLVQVLDRQGGVIASSANLRGEPALTTEPSLAESLSGQRVLSDVVDEDGRAVRVLHIPIDVGGQVMGVLTVGQSRETLKEVMEQLLKQLLLLGGGALVVAGLVGWLVAHKGLQPLAAIARRAANIAARRDFSERLQVSGPRDEVRRLSRTIDELLATVDDTLRQHREFVADTSHELRNPLLALRTNLELLDRVTDAEGRAECIREANQQVERMSRLVSELLLLARVEAVQVVERKPVRLERVVGEVIRGARLQAYGQRVRVGKMEPMQVLGDEDRIAQVLNNLVDNAVVHAGEDATITLALEREDGWAKLSVADTGRGIPPKDLPHIFERFYRVDGGRASRKGSGLGLAIVRHLCEAHGGRVTAESEAGKGSRFTVWLRSSEAAPVRASSARRSQRNIPAPASAQRDQPHHALLK